MRRLVRAGSRFASRCALVENLESRLLLSTYSPSQIRQAYGINGVYGDGTGQTIAIVDAYNNTHIANDLNTFDQTFSANGGASLYAQYGAAANFLTVATLGSGTPSDAGWAMEADLDVEWAHAIAPGAKIVLVQAHSTSLGDLLAAVNYARNISSVSVVSMSWGTSEFSGELNYDSYFTTPAGHKGITFVASSGDNGAGAGWPAIADNVLSVGGTSLTLSGSNYVYESAWSGSGGGYSAYESKPSYQSGVNATSRRSNPDVAYDANTSTGFYVYDSSYYGQGGWWSVGGTSAGAPQWAALIALTDQVRAIHGGASLSTGQVLNTLYTMPASDFHDITSGSNGYSAKAGYDLATGRGSPVANLLVPALASTTASSNIVVGGGTVYTQTQFRAAARTSFQVVDDLAAMPPLTVSTHALPATLLTAPLAISAAPATTIFVVNSTQRLAPVAAPLAEARIADPEMPPSTDEILPSGDSVADELVAPAPFAQLLDEAVPAMNEETAS